MWVPTNRVLLYLRNHETTYLYFETSRNPYSETEFTEYIVNYSYRYDDAWLTRVFEQLVIVLINYDT